MERIAVLITECGGPAGVGIIKSFKALQRADIVLIGIDAGKYCAGFELCDYSYTSPKGGDKNYISFIEHLVQEHTISFIVCAGEHDLYNLALSRDSLGCKIFISSPDTIKICQNKLLFYETCRDHFDLPATYCGPLFSKPIRGSGSRGVSVVGDTSTIFQELLPGREYTVDVFCDSEYKPTAIVPRERLEIKSGISTKSRIYPDRELIEISERLCNFLQIVGACNIQFKEDINGKRKIIEVNPRLAGGGCMSLCVGINFAQEYLDALLCNERASEGHSVKFPESEKIVVRYFEEVVASVPVVAKVANNSPPQ
jgi:carbamoyl-phosphate synthase large subunit